MNYLTDSELLEMAIKYPLNQRKVITIDANAQMQLLNKKYKLVCDEFVPMMVNHIEHMF